MEYKRLEIYVGWTCNQKCTYCMEFQNMEKAWKQKVTKYEILKKLIKYKKLGYNHVTYLGGEPFIQGVFKDALLLAKKLNYTTLVTTNATTLHIDAQAEKFLPYIDELFLSVQAIDIDDQQKISRTKNFVSWDKVFENINKYWNGKTLKANIVITQDNLEILDEIVKYLHKKNLKEIAITYPDIAFQYYGKKHILEKVAPNYKKCVEKILPIVEFCEINKINLKLPDFPFCVFPEENREKYIRLTDDFDYSTRLKITYDNSELKRDDLKSEDDLPRQRKNIKNCENCKYLNKCWGVSRFYDKLYGLDEIISIKK